MSNRKRSNNYNYSNRNYQRQRKHDHQNDATANASTSGNDNEIPGFYYDEEKKRYFKIQANHQRQASCVTNDVIKTKMREDDLSKSLKKMKPINLIKNILLNFELGIVNRRRLCIDRNNYLVANSKRKSMVELDIRDKISSTSVLQFNKNSDFVYLLCNCRSSMEFIKVYKTDDKFANTHITQLESDSEISNFESSRNMFLNIQDDKYLIKMAEINNVYTTSVSEWIVNRNENESLNEWKLIFNNVFHSENDVTCIRLNSGFDKKFTKLSIGHDDHALVLKSDERRGATCTSINTLTSRVFSQRFHPIVSITSILLFQKTI